MYLTETAELAHKTKIKDGWRQSNKNDGSPEIVQSYSHQHAIQVRLLNLASIRRRGGDLSPDILQHLEMTSSPHPELISCKRILKGHQDDVSNLDDCSMDACVSFPIVCRELIRFSQHNLPPEHKLPENPAKLGSLPVGLLTQVEIPVQAFQESEVYDIHRA